MSSRQERWAIAIPVCGAFGGLALSLTVYAVQYHFLSGEPLWIPVATATAWPGYRLNEHYSLFNDILPIGPIIGCVGSILLFNQADFKSIGWARAVASCVAAYYFQAVIIAPFLKTKTRAAPDYNVPWCLAACGLPGNCIWLCHKRHTQ